jgi:hypothetical protein
MKSHFLQAETLISLKSHETVTRKTALVMKFLSSVVVANCIAIQLKDVLSMLLETS